MPVLCLSKTKILLPPNIVFCNLYTLCCLPPTFVKMKLILSLCALLAISTAYEITDIASGRIETCRGCSLNRLPEVKKFVMNDAPGYENIEVKFITGAPPELVLLDENDHELERIPLSQLNREECNNVLRERGFFQRNTKSDL